jgi:hypothetical protein
MMDAGVPFAKMLENREKPAETANIGRRPHALDPKFRFR